MPCWDAANFCPLEVSVAGVRVVEFGPKRAVRRAWIVSCANRSQHRDSLNLIDPGHLEISLICVGDY